MKLLYNRFFGEIPQADPSLLPQQNAQRAWNLVLERGTLKPFHKPQFYRKASKERDQLTIYRFAPVPGDPESGWLFSWQQVVDCVPGPVAGNTQHLTYWTGEDWPRYCDHSIGTGDGVLPNASYRLGVPTPEFAPHAERFYEEPPEPDDKDDDEDEEPETDASLEVDRDYVLTFVHQLGSLQMESAPSPPSRILTIPAEPGFGVKLTNIAVMPGGPYPAGSKRLYRRIYSGGLTQFALVAELGANDFSYEDVAQDFEIPGDLLISEHHNEPLEDMHSLGVLTNGIMYGASGNDVCLSEPYLPHAWSPFARYPLPHDVVGVGQSDSNIVAVTLKNPYIITGFSPSNMSVVELNMQQGCLSKRSIVSGLFGCIYASPDGLVIITGGASRTLTDGLITQKQWQALNPASMISAVNEDLLIVCFEQKDGTRGSFILDPNQPEAGIRFSDQYFTAQYHDGLLDSLLVYDPQQQGIALWNEGETLPYTWRSRLNILPVMLCFTAARVEAKSYKDLTFRMYADDELKHEQTVTDGRMFRMVSGYCARTVQVEVTGTDEVRQVCIAEAPYELE